MEMNLILIPIIAGFVGVPIIIWLFWWLGRESAGTPRMKELAGYIQQGAYTFLKREFKTISYVIIPLAILLFFLLGWQITVGFVMGALFSMLAILIGMSGAVRANVRTANAARTSPGRSLVLAFRGGAIMGFSIVSLVLIGIGSLYLLFGVGPTNPEGVHLLVGFGFGASLSALFAQVGGGIYTKAASKMVDEVRRQFKEIPGLLEGKAKPDYSRCVDISTKYSLKQMVLPVLVGLIAPIIMGFTFGVWPLAAYLLGVKIVGALLAVFMFNSGGAWDNAKKLIEAGHYGGKGSSAHSAAVKADTVGDPLKDAAGPSLHILIKLQNILAITLLPLFLAYAIF